MSLSDWLQVGLAVLVWLNFWDNWRTRRMVKLQCDGCTASVKKTCDETVDLVGQRVAQVGLSMQELRRSEEYKKLEQALEERSLKVHVRN